MNQSFVGVCGEWALHEGCEWMGLRCAQIQCFLGRLGGLTSGAITLAVGRECTMRELEGI